MQESAGALPNALGVRAGGWGDLRSLQALLWAMAELHDSRPVVVDLCGRELRGQHPFASITLKGAHTSVELRNGALACEGLVMGEAMLNVCEGACLTLADLHLSADFDSVPEDDSIGGTAVCVNAGAVVLSNVHIEVTAAPGKWDDLTGIRVKGSGSTLASSGTLSIGVRTHLGWGTGVHVQDGASVLLGGQCSIQCHSATATGMSVEGGGMLDLHGDCNITCTSPASYALGAGTGLRAADHGSVVRSMGHLLVSVGPGFETGRCVAIADGADVQLGGGCRLWCDAPYAHGVYVCSPSSRAELSGGCSMVCTNSSSSGLVHQLGVCVWAEDDGCVYCPHEAGRLELTIAAPGFDRGQGVYVWSGGRAELLGGCTIVCSAREAIGVWAGHDDSFAELGGDCSVSCTGCGARQAGRPISAYCLKAQSGSHVRHSGGELSFSIEGPPRLCMVVHSKQEAVVQLEEGASVRSSNPGVVGFKGQAGPGSVLELRGDCTFSLA